MTRIRNLTEIPELTLGQALTGEIAKGADNPETIAFNVMVLYSDEWLSRRLVELLAKEARRHLAAHRVVA